LAQLAGPVTVNVSMETRG